MRRTSMLLAALIATSGSALAGKKDKKAPPADAGAPAAEEIATELPGDANSKKFASTLMGLTIKDFKPMDNAGATFKYDNLKFNAGNIWNAKGFVQIGEERMDCNESGTWHMDPAESASVAAVMWVVEKTDCAGREPGTEARVQMTLGKDGIDEILFR